VKTLQQQAHEQLDLLHAGKMTEDEQRYAAAILGELLRRRFIARPQPNKEAA
jgi:hypothetical protein